jgi:hypothetical protein
MNVTAFSSASGSGAEADDGEGDGIVMVGKRKDG